MKFLFLSGYGEGLGIALRLKQNGHNVAAWIKDKQSKRNYDGLIQKLTKWDTFLDKDTIVVFDSTGGGKTGDRLRARGFHVFGGSVIADQLEIDRAVGFEFLQQAKVKLPEYESFTDWGAGRDFAKHYKGRLVFKPSGELSGEGGVGSYAAFDPDDMVEMLEYYESISHVQPEFILQQFVEGLPISTEGWFNGEDFILPWNHTLEHKSLMNEDIGPSGGCCGNIVWRVDGTNRVIEEGLKRMGPILKEFEYVGPIDLNTIVNPEGVWALEFTARFGYDATPTLLELWQGDPGELIASVARGEHPKTMLLEDGFAAAVRLSVSPYPAEEFKPQPGIPVRGFERSDRPHLYFYGVQLNEKNQLMTTSGYGLVAALTGKGKSISEAFDGPIELAEKAKVPEKQYRTDLKQIHIEDYNKFLELTQVVEEADGARPDTPNV
jgi:phosphoribosylamine--glycine ligase